MTLKGDRDRIRLGPPFALPSPVTERVIWEMSVNTEARLAMLRTRIAIGSCALALSVFWLSDAQGNLGDTLSQAKARGKAYETQYGAVAPLFETDANGKVNWECWAAPPEQWTKDQAMKFARRLIPKAMAAKPPKHGAKDGVYEPYFYPDGTVVIFQVMNLVVQGVRGNYFGVEVHSPNYAGQRC